MTKFSLAKISAKGSFFVMGQKFHQIQFHQSRKLSSGKSCGWSSRVAMYICVCSHNRARMCQNFHCAKKNFFANGMHWRNWQKFSPGENFHVYGSSRFQAA